MTNTELIEKVAALAVADWNKTGVILPSVTIAQAILESGWGKSTLTTKGNALFGIKAGTSWKGKRLSLKTWEIYDGKRVDITDAFRAYDSWEESVTDHSAFLGGIARYKNIVGNTDAEEVCKLLQQDGYATATNYAASLLKLINQHDLTRYDAFTGWKQQSGHWMYWKDGVVIKNQWLHEGGYWYWLDGQGRMLTGLQKIGGKLYMLNPKRAHNVPTGACIITDSTGAVKEG